MPAASGICSSRRSRLSEWEVLCSALGFGESSSCVRFKRNQKLEAIVSARSRSRLLFNWQFNVLYQDRESRIGPKEEHGHTAIPVLSLRWCFWLHGQLHSQQTCTATGRGGLVPCCQRAALTTSTRKETSAISRSACCSHSCASTAEGVLTYGISLPVVSSNVRAASENMHHS